MLRRHFLCHLGTCAVLGTTALGHASGADRVTVFAAASLQTALDEVAATLAQMGGPQITIVPAGSSILARQIAHGAPADLFISANQAWMDHLAEADRLVPESRVALLSNRLVLIGPAGAPPLSLDAQDAFAARLGPDGRLAMALVDAVPAGIYGKAALENLGLWAAAAPHIAQTDNVRAALALVATGAAPLGIVYATDAQAEPRVRIIAEIPSQAHPPILYPAAQILGSGPAAVRVLRYLQSDSAGAIFARHGFALPAR